MSSPDVFRNIEELRNLKEVLSSEIFPDKGISHLGGGYTLGYDLQVSVKINGNFGLIYLEYVQYADPFASTQKIYEYLQSIGLTDLKIVHDSVITPKENIQHLITLYRMKGMIQ